MTRRKVKAKRQPSGPPRGRGRPSEYTDAIANAICQRIADGESLRSICQDKAMPDRSTVFRWLSQKRGFRDLYTRAREAQADLLFDEIISIADNTKGDFVEVKQGKETVVRANHANVHRDRLKVDARKWVASKLQPRKYGEHFALGPGVDDEGKPVAPVLNILRYPLTKEEEAAQARFLNGDDENGANGKTRHHGPD
jgi:hypothetical protein